MEFRTRPSGQSRNTTSLHTRLQFLSDIPEEEYRVQEATSQSPRPSRVTDHDHTGTVPPYLLQLRLRVSYLHVREYRYLHAYKIFPFTLTATYMDIRRQSRVRVENLRVSQENIRMQGRRSDSKMHTIL